MATTALSLTPGYRPFSSAAHAKDATRPSPQPANQGSTLSNQVTSTSFQSSTYSLSIEQRAMLARLEQVGIGNGSESSFQAEQLEFSFFAESRLEELAIFQERLETAAEGAPESRRSSLVAMTQQISARFEFSISMSATSLNGFSNAADGSTGSEDLMDRLFDITQKLLSESDDLFQDFFSLFDGSVSDSEGNSLEKLMRDLTEAFFGNQKGQGGQQASMQSVQLEFSFSFSAEVSVTQGQVQQSDPIILDLDNDGFELSSYRDGAQFDILGNGGVQKTAFVTGGDAFLALDRNSDGKINSGRELFGDQYGAANGYEELRKLDGNSDGLIDVHDAAYEKLLLFKDDGDGVTEEGELVTLSKAGISSISLNYSHADQLISGGNRMAQLASYTRTDGSRGRAGDAILNYIA